MEPHQLGVHFKPLVTPTLQVIPGPFSSLGEFPFETKEFTNLTHAIERGLHILKEEIERKK